ncbi:MAG: cyclic nucleotide-binding domain-containing protein, partial [Betaproteobacteria bacterium]
MLAPVVIDSGSATFTVDSNSTPSSQFLDQPPNANACSACRVRGLCQPGGLSESDSRQFDALVFSRRRVKQGHALYRAGDPCASVYLVRSGFVKAVVMHADGREQ